MSAAQDRDAYKAALIAGRTTECLTIEQRYGLDGYPPQVVSVGLAAAAQGRDAHEAIEAYFDGCPE